MVAAGPLELGGERTAHPAGGRMQKWSRIALLGIASGVLVAVGPPSAAAAPAASILIFPRVVADDADDTLIEITNASNRRTYLRCGYVDATGTPATSFELALVGQQPTHWAVSRGRPVDDGDMRCTRAAADCDGAGLDPGAVPAMAAPFAGALVCVQLDRSGAPLSGNALRGRATIASGDGDVATYDALGLLGYPSNDADDVLCVDGLANPSCTTAEYSACPSDWQLLHAADGAPSALAAGRRQVHGSLTALPCALALGGAPAALALQITTTDALDQHFTAAAQLAPLAPTALADLSPILAASAGDPIRHTRLLSAAGDGFMLLAESERRLAGDPAAPGGRTASTSGAAAAGSALVVLPYLLVDAAGGTDTVVQVANTSEQPLRAHCAYDVETPSCDSGVAGDSCLPGGAGCSGTCLPTHGTIEFDLALAAAQPLAWRVGSGLSRSVSDAVAAVAIPPAGDAFLGLLRCVAVDGAGRPVERNALRATASIETFEAAADPAADYVDAAQYDAVEQPAVAGAGDGDAFLALGGSSPEYAACADTLVLSHVFDGATVRLATRQDTVHTTLALAPCAADIGGDEPATDVVQFFVYNEFGQRFSTSSPISGQLVTEMSRIDTTDPTRSIFAAGVAGTLAGQTRIQSAGGGVVGVAVQRHVGSAGGREHSAAFALPGEGAQAALDVVALRLRACAGDCDGSGQVAIDELLRGVNIGLGALPLSACAAFDTDGDGMVAVGELIQGVGASLGGCPPAGTRPTPPPTPTPEPTAPPVVSAPEVTFFGLVSGDDQPLAAETSDAMGRPVFVLAQGEGFGVVVEGRPGTTRRNVGQSAFVEGGAALPDLQMIVDRDLGDGSAAICDADPPNAGGVPAAVPFAFDAPNAVAAINDLGCRADSGGGAPQATGIRMACTRLGRFFLARESTTRFCVPVDHAWAFPTGDTTVAVRLRDVSGEVGPSREIVVRVEP